MQAPTDSSPEWIRWCALGLLVAGTVFGAAQLSFLCDDAFIHFRYAVNAHAGHGLVWNAEPFRPVEGAGFLWILALWAMWSWFGLEPHVAANPFLIACGAVQIVIVAASTTGQTVSRRGLSLDRGMRANLSQFPRPVAEKIRPSGPGRKIFAGTHMPLADGSRAPNPPGAHP